MPSKSSILAAAFAATASARDIPSNVQSLYNSIVSQGSCNNVLADGFWSTGNTGPEYVYCGDHLDDYGIVYLQGPGGNLANVDIDCDGVQHGKGDDGRCGSSGDTQSITSFQWVVSQYSNGVEDLNPFVHDYVVFGNSGDTPGWATFNPQDYGIEPLSIMAVVCNNKLVFGVWGDSNGDDGPHPMIGETSISLATACFGTSVNGNAGYDGEDILYIGFTGSDAVPGTSANWRANSESEFQASLEDLGNDLLSRIGNTSGGGGNGGGSGGNGGSGGGVSCEWAGHCEGASCGTMDDCSGSLVCTDGVCTAEGCSWPGHCAGASCSNLNDCADALTCINGACA